MSEPRGEASRPVLLTDVKFSPTGGRVKIAAAATEDEAVMTVSDTGPGISPKEQARLFQRFSRGPASRSADVPGVGLAIAPSALPVHLHPIRPRPGRPVSNTSPASTQGPHRGGHSHRCG